MGRNCCAAAAPGRRRCLRVLCPRPRSGASPKQSGQTKSPPVQPEGSGSAHCFGASPSLRPWTRCGRDPAADLQSSQDACLVPCSKPAAHRLIKIRAPKTVQTLGSTSMPVVHPHRKVHGQHPLRVLDHGADVLLQFERVGRDVKVLHRHVIGVPYDKCGSSGRRHLLLSLKVHLASGCMKSAPGRARHPDPRHAR